MTRKNNMVQALKSYLSATKINRTGRSVRQKFIIIESDDWGAIRTPSKEAVAAFQRKGLEIANSLYQKDALESESDLELLFETLSKHKDAQGNPAKLTANTIMANPDFDRIKQADFTEFYYERFTDTFQRYPKHSRNLSLYKEGKAQGVFQPQFHGREHLNHKRWLRVLQDKNEAAHFCFDWKATYSGKGDYSFMEAYDWDIPSDISQHKTIIADGLRIFRETFGESSASFIAPCYNWDSRIEDILAEQGVEWIQGLKAQLAPTGTFDQYKPVLHAFGEQNALGLRYNIRNCMFEPSMNPGRDWVSSCMAQINSAFHWRKPAVICAHRINFIGYIDESNRTRGLHDLDTLLKRILRKWPDVHFISTDELSHYLTH